MFSSYLVCCVTGSHGACAWPIFLPSHLLFRPFLNFLLGVLLVFSRAACSTRERVCGPRRLLSCTWRARRKLRVRGPVSTATESGSASKSQLIWDRIVFACFQSCLTHKPSDRLGFPRFSDPCWTSRYYQRARPVSSSLELSNSWLWILENHPLSQGCRSSFLTVRFPMKRWTDSFRDLATFCLETWVSVDSI